MNQPSLTFGQKGLLFTLYGLIALMIIFSLISLRNLGQEGYARCLEKRCAAVGEEQCQKLREVSSCCLGAGGDVVVQNNQYGCAYN